MPAQWVATREVPVGDLTPFPGNARRGNVAEIRRSLVTNGQYRAIVVRLTGDDVERPEELTILAGNHTYAAMCNLVEHPPTLEQILEWIPEDERELYRTSAEFLLDQIRRGVIRCDIIRCSDREARKINLADNRLSDIAIDDADALVELLSYLDGDYAGTGWNATDVELLITPPPDLDDLNKQLGDPEDDDTWPSVRIKAPHHVIAAWNDLLKSMGDNEAAAFAKLLGVDLDLIGSQA